MISYNIKVNLRMSDNRLSVSACIELQKADMIKGFEMLLTSDAEVRSVRSKMNHKWINIPYDFTGKDTLRLTIPPALASSQELTIDFEYTLPVSESEDLMILDRGHRWYPLILDQIARFKLTAEVPCDYVVFSAGNLVEEKTFPEYSQFIWESKIPVFKIPLIVTKTGIYKETVKEIDGKKIYLYSSTIDEKTGKKIVSEACRIFKFFSGFIGEYPHNRLTLIEIPGLKGINIATALLMLGSTSIDEFKKGYYRGLHFSIAAQWFAAGVFFKFFGKGFWFLEVSLPHYLRLMYLEQTGGRDAFDKGLQRGLDAYKKIAGTDKDVPIIEVDFPNTREKGMVIYGKGPWVLDRVRNLIGDENWEKFLKDIYKDFRGGILTYDEFKKHLSKYDKDGSCIIRLERWLTETNVPGD